MTLAVQRDVNGNLDLLYQGALSNREPGDLNVIFSILPKKVISLTSGAGFMKSLKLSQTQG